MMLLYLISADSEGSVTFLFPRASVKTSGLEGFSCRDFLCVRSTDETAALFYTLYLYGSRRRRRTSAVFNTLTLYEVNLNIFIDDEFYTGTM